MALQVRFDRDEIHADELSIVVDDKNFQQNVDPHNHVHIVVGQPRLPAVSTIPPAQVQQIDLKVTNNAVLDDEQYNEVKELWKGIDNVFANPGLGHPPSTNRKSSYYHIYQENPAAIHDGRYGTHRNTTLAPPVELYHPVFAEFKAHLNNPTLELPPDVVLNTMELMVATSEIKTLESERINVRGIVEKLCSLAIMKSENKDGTKPDYIFPVTRNSPPIEVALVAVVEEKGELGVNGDPTVQASFSYIHYWADPSRQSLCRKNRNCTIIHTVRFEYLRPLEPEESLCVTFLAKQLTSESTDDKLIVVKFVERYGEQAHRLLAAEKLAPELFYLGPLISPQEAAWKKALIIDFDWAGEAVNVEPYGFIQAAHDDAMVDHPQQTCLQAPNVNVIKTSLDVISQPIMSPF
ncbi:hypothetical protein Clacol_005436 [Clathrus columnatus]|uniref:Uncharacterized protein n=1 Tax=Clathrus columnatus TaxID=1419009 RepID=A0AAV5A9C9_9AGAM|nr:hypothetical protein Clacol_005436 [Clathrus columnatus]